MKSFDDNMRLNAQCFSHSALIVIDQAQTEARVMGWSRIRSPHMGIAIFAHPDSDVSICARKHGVRVEKIVKEFRNQFLGDENPLECEEILTESKFSENALQCLNQATQVALSRGVKQVDERDIWRAILMDPGNFFVKTLLANGIWPLWLLPYGW